MSKPAVELTESEWSIIKGRLGKPSPAPPPAIRKTFQPTAALFDRPHADGPHGGQGAVLKAKRRASLTIYHSAVTAPRRRAAKLFYALKHAFNGALTPMVQCLLESKDLKAEELAELEHSSGEEKIREK